MTFQVVIEGQCWLKLAGEPATLLKQGNLCLLPHGTPHRLCNSLDAVSESLEALPVQPVSERYETLSYGGGGEKTHVTYGVMRLDHVAAKHLLLQLPRVMVINSWDDATSVWLQSTLRFIANEAATPRPGGETVITRLADILVIQAIRAWLDQAPEARHGWLAALRDAQLGRALAAIHQTPAHPWRVDTLARLAGMSRSAFSARFTELVGQSAMQYVNHWRLQLARTRLQEGSEPLGVVAANVGYTSEAAFSRAFKRLFGLSPGRVRAQG